MQDGIYGQKYLLIWVFLPYIIFKAQGNSLKKKEQPAFCKDGGYTAFTVQT